MSNKWDHYFYSICNVVASNSNCMSRQIGAILVYDHSIISTGYNGPARDIPHCGQDRFLADETLKMLGGTQELNELYSPEEINNTCPRHLLGYRSGEALNLCPALHAEINCIINAARLGTAIEGSTLYMNSIIPCKDCFSALQNAGVVEIVVEKLEHYDRLTNYIRNHSKIDIREFKL